MASPAQLAAQALSSLARVGAFVGVGATAVASAMYDGAYFSFFSLSLFERAFRDSGVVTPKQEKKEDQK